MSKQERIFLNRLKANISETVYSRNISYEELCKEFGYPSDIICSYFEDHDVEYIIKQSRIKNTIKKAIIVCSIAVILCCLWKSVLIYKSHVDSENSRIEYVEYTIEEIE